jgi:SAM-dependent methyltransferase
MTSAADWSGRVGDAWAAEWRRTDRSFSDLARHLDAAILVAAPAGPATVLDIGCGAGATTAALIAARPDSKVVGVDLSPELMAVAQDRVPSASFVVADAAHDPLPVRRDLLISRHGVMFFADPVAAFTRLREAAAPRASLVFSCFRERARNAFASDLLAAVIGNAPADPPGYAPGPFGFADRALVTDILTGAGWSVEEPTSVDFDYIAGEGSDPVEDATSFLTRIGPVSAAIAAAPDPAALLARLTAALAAYQVDDRVLFPASAWIWRAHAGEPGR